MDDMKGNTMPPLESRLVRNGAILLCALPLIGCVYATADLHPATADLPARAAAAHLTKNPGDVAISESNDVGKSYQILGAVTGYARRFSLLSANPTREDVNEALRAEAAKIGADAVINIDYRTESAGLFGQWERGRIVAEGLAVKTAE
jgi:uncharacterized protein YbjQ (UPF0145 family)